MSEKIKNFLNHERYQLISLFAACLFLLFVYSCESTVPSMANPSQKVTRGELQAEIDYYLARAEVRFKNLDQQDQLKKLLLDNALIISQGGTLNPYGLVASIVTILGAGAAVDNVRRRKLDKQKLTYEPTNVSTTTDTPA